MREERQERQERQETLGESIIMVCDKSYAQPVGRNLGHEQDIVNTLFLRKKASLHGAEEILSFAVNVIQLVSTGRPRSL